MPACRIPPPSIFRTLLASLMKSWFPTKTEPTGAPRPFDKHRETVSKLLANSLGVHLLAMAAFINLAPSRCERRLTFLAAAVAHCIYLGDSGLPLYVFSRQRSLVRGKCISSDFTFPIATSMSIDPSSSTGTVCGITPPRAAVPTASDLYM